MLIMLLVTVVTYRECLTYIGTLPFPSFPTSVMNLKRENYLIHMWKWISSIPRFSNLEKNLKICQVETKVLLFTYGNNKA